MERKRLVWMSVLIGFHVAPALAGEFECPLAEGGDFYAPAPFRLEALPDNDGVPPVEPVRFGTFDEAAYGFSHAAVFLHRVGPFDEGLHGGPLGPLKIVVQVDTSEGARSWQLVPDEALAERQYMDGDDFLRSTPHGPEPEQVRRLSEDASVPVFTIRYDAHVGDRSFYELERYLLLDLRTLPPRALAALECHTFTGGTQGACGTWDYQYRDISHFTCRWEASSKDVLCEENHHLPTDWTGRSYVTHFYPGRREEPVPASVSRLAPLTADALIDAPPEQRFHGRRTTAARQRIGRAETEPATNCSSQEDDAPTSSRVCC